MSASTKFQPSSCGLCFNPPTLVLFYNDLDTGKRRKRSMPLRDFDSDTDVLAYATDLMQSQRHSKYIDVIPHTQLKSLLRKVKDVQCGKAPPMSPLTHKLPPPPRRHQSSLMDIPPITLTSPSHNNNNSSSGKQFDSELDKLLNFDDDGKEDKQRTSVGSDSLEDLLETASGGGQKEKSVKESTQLSDLPGLSRLGDNHLCNGGAGGRNDDDPLLGVLSGAVKRPFEGTPRDPAKQSSLGNLPPLGGTGTTLQNEEKKKKKSGDGIHKSDNHLSPFEAGHKSNSSRVPALRGDTFATEVPDYSNDFYSEYEGDEAGAKQGKRGRDDLEDRSLALSELLEDGDDSSLGLGLGDKKYFTGVKLSGSSSGDDFKRLADIVTPPQLSDDDAHLPPLSSLQQSKSTFGHGDEDLNKANDEYLAQKKEEMNLLYEANCVKPEDAGYVYDKEIHFDNEPKMESGWDSDDSMSDF